MSELTLTIPGIPPSVNHIWEHGRRGHHYLSEAALSFYTYAIALNRQRTLMRGSDSEQRKQKFELEAWVYLGKGQRGDGDNFLKAIGDSARKSGMIRTDAAVKRWIVNVERDRENPRTVITIRGQ